MKLLFWILKYILKLVSLIPVRVLFILSDIIQPIFSKVLKYRKKVILENLYKSFPAKNENEIKTIFKQFYHHFSDLFVEIIKLFSLSEKELFKRVTVSDEQVLTQLANDKKGVVVVMSHTGNWEWISQRVCYSGRCFDYVGVVAKEISNPYFDTIFTDLRMRLQQGFSQIIPFNQTSKHLAAVRHKTSMIITIADQTPHRDQIQYRTTFLNQDSGVFLGPERIAKSLNFAVVFCHVSKPARGKYHIRYELITAAPKESPTYEITNKHVKMLEDDINIQPETWLWSHRRWKYQAKNVDSI